jgi:hypothetical protein
MTHPAWVCAGLTRGTHGPGAPLPDIDIGPVEWAIVQAILGEHVLIQAAVV